jgi:coiled-coil domain-containing protein 130
VWRDPYTANQRLRREFRGERHRLEREGRVKEGLQEKFSFGFEIADEVEADGVRAKLVEFGGAQEPGEAVSKRGLFEKKDAEKAAVIVPKKGKLKSEILAEKSRQSLQHALVGNTKAAIDPFLKDSGRANSKTPVRILKRKRTEDANKDTGDTRSTMVRQLPDKTVQSAPAQRAPPPLTLVGYDSD